MTKVRIVYKRVSAAAIFASRAWPIAAVLGITAAQIERTWLERVDLPYRARHFGDPPQWHEIYQKEEENGRPRPATNLRVCSSEEAGCIPLLELVR